MNAFPIGQHKKVKVEKVQCNIRLAVDTHRLAKTWAAYNKVSFCEFVDDAVKTKLETMK